MGDSMTLFRGTLDHIHITGAGSQPMQALAVAELVAGVGLAHDRYATRTGTYSDRHHIDRQVTLIESETLTALQRDHRVDLAPHEHRRNLTTTGAPLSHLVGEYFRVGECVLYGGRLNVPCKYLEGLVGRPVFRILLHRSGLNARVVVGGEIRPGDVIEPCDPAVLDPALVANNDATALEPPHDPFEN